MCKELVIAIDGPGASGKSTIAKILAKKLNYTYIDTGAMYRSLALYVLENNIDYKKEENLIKASNEIDISFDNEGNVFLNGKNVSKEIRENEVTKLSSPVSCPRKVREIFVAKQKELAKKVNGVVMDGRDIGTVVLDDADLKIYQIASIEVRTKRRFLENQSKGINVPLETLKLEIEKRDELDKSKEFGALKKANDAIELDTSNMSIDEVVDFIYKKVVGIKNEKSNSSNCRKA